MKIIGFEEHFGLPFIHDAALKANDPYGLVLETLRKSGQFPEDSKTGCPAGIYDLAEGWIAAMDDAGLDVQILSYATPSAERLEPSLSRELTGQANDAVAAAASKYPDRFLGFATLRSGGDFDRKSRQGRAACNNRQTSGVCAESFRHGKFRCTWVARIPRGPSGEWQALLAAVVYVEKIMLRNARRISQSKNTIRRRYK
jgi:hypothetical protein